MRRKNIYLPIVVMLLLSIVSPIQPSAATNVERLITEAEKHAGALKWQISVEHTKEIKYPDMKIFNQTKDAYIKAKAAVGPLTGSEKTKLETRLENNAGIHYKRAMGYIDAITSGKKIVKKADEYATLYANDPIGDVTEQAYHDLSAEIRKQAILLYRVYGYSTRQAILSTFKTPGETELEKTKYGISAKMKLDEVEDQINRRVWHENIDPSIEQFFILLNEVETEVAAQALYERYYYMMRNVTSFIIQEHEITEMINASNEAFNNKDLEAFSATIHSEYPNREEYLQNINQMFETYDIQYETVEVEMISFLYHEAVVRHVETEKNLNQADFTDSISEKIYIIKLEDNQWKYVDGFLVESSPLNQ